MEIKIVDRSPKEVANCDYSDAREIYIDDVLVFSVHDGEPEDNNIGRNFNDIYRLEEIFKKIHTAGVAGRELTINSEESDEI